MDPLSAIGGASAVIGLIQSGFSLAQALHEYAKDVKNVPDEIIGLPDRLFESVGLVDEVNNLLTLNRQSHAWNELGVRRAEGDIVVCYGIITPLQELLGKAGIGSTGNITKEDLNLSVLESLIWPIKYGSKVEKTKDDLQKFYSRVSVTILTYQVRTSTSIVQKTASEKKLAQLLAKEMAGKQPQGKGELKDFVRKYRKGDGRASKPILNTRSPGSESPSDEEDNLESICTALMDITRAELIREDVSLKVKEEIRQKEADDAVAAWQAKAKERWQEQEAKRVQLRGQLSGRLELSAIDAVVNNVFPEGAEIGAPRGTTPTVTQPSSGTNVSMPAFNTTSKRKRRFGLFKSRGPTPLDIDTDLQEMLSPAGRQFLRGFVIAYDQEQRIQITPMNAPQHVLVQKLSTSPVGTTAATKGSRTAWEEYGYLPSTLRQAINGQCKTLGKNSSGESFWTVVHLERILNLKKSGLFRSRIEQIKGAYVIFRQVNPSGAEAIEPIVPENDDNDPRARSYACPAADTEVIEPNKERYKSEIEDVLVGGQYKSAYAAASGRSRYRSGESDSEVGSIDSDVARKLESVFGPGSVGKYRRFMRAETMRQGEESRIESEISRLERERSRLRRSRQRSASSASSSDRRSRSRSRSRSRRHRHDRRGSTGHQVFGTPCYTDLNYSPPPRVVRSEPRRRQSSGYSDTRERKPRSRHARFREDSNIYHSPQPLRGDYDRRASPSINIYSDEPITTRMYAASEPRIRERIAPSRQSRRSRARNERRNSENLATEYGDGPVEDEVARLMSELTTGTDEALSTQAQDSAGYGVPERVNAIEITAVTGAKESEHEPTVSQAPRSDTFALSDAEAGESVYQSPTATAGSEEDAPLQVIQGEAASRDLRPR